MIESPPILHTEASTGWGGQEIRILTDIRWQIQSGHPVHLAAPPGSGIWEAVGDLGVVRWPFRFSKRSQLGDAVRLVGLLRRIRPGWIATHSSVDSWVGLIAARLASPQCLRVRYRHVSTPVAARIQNRWQYRVLAQRVITTAECIRAELVRTFDLSPDRIVSIPTGIDPPTVLPDPASARRELLARLGLDDRQRLIGQVSVLRSWKGHPDLIEAFTRIAPAHPDLHLVLVGDGPQRDRLIATIADHPLSDRIHLTGHLFPVWPVFRALDVAVLASRRNEGVPQSGIQAMLAETPFVGTRCGGIPELINTDNPRGWLAEPNAPESLATAITAALQPDGRVARARETAREEYSIATLRARTEKQLGLPDSALLSFGKDPAH